MIYSSTFEKESLAAINALDDGIGKTEDNLNELCMLFSQYTKGKKSSLIDETKDAVTDYEDTLSRMSIAINDLYSMKNQLIHWIGQSKYEEFLSNIK